MKANIDLLHHLCGAFNYLDGEDKIILNKLINKYSFKNDFQASSTELAKYTKTDKSKHSYSIQQSLRKAFEYIESIYGEIEHEEVEFNYCYGEIRKIKDYLASIRCFISENSINEENKRVSFEIFDTYSISLLIDEIVKCYNLGNKEVKFLQRIAA